MWVFSRKAIPKIDQEQKELIEHAQTRLRQKKRLYYHFVLLLAGAIVIIIINLTLEIGKDFTPLDKPWFVWILLLWNFLFLVHLINVLILGSFMNKKWENAQIEKLVNKQQEKIAQIQEKINTDKSFPLKNTPTQVSNSNNYRPKYSPMITMIAAASENQVLGKNNKLIWHLPDDFKRFKELTTGHHIIMGRKTWESFPKPLPNRIHIVITRNKQYKAHGAIVVHGIKDALAYAKKDTNIFIIGGGEIYTIGLDYATHIELTRVHDLFEGDAFFPEINSDVWKLKESISQGKDDRHKHSFTFETWVKQ